ncbi:Heat shock protein DnaJ, cysteine-rich domain superfamily [Sesbania bispinosa]|nr:Heat shock protein DnaJ, cysteine-rich domain superfamily [Sesbania bispinosa]
MAFAFVPSLSLTLPSIPKHTRFLYIKPLHCAPIQQQVDADAGATIMCEPCNGKGWLLCDFCQGQKTNVKAENKRLYRRCPSCRAVGYVLCSNCKPFYYNPNAKMVVQVTKKGSFNNVLTEKSLNIFIPAPPTHQQLNIIFRSKH